MVVYCVLVVFVMVVCVGVGDFELGCVDYGVWVV